MKGDFSRLTFDARRHFVAPLQQQGRVATDADWNDWVESVLYRLKVETIDVIGQCGRPIHDPGFGISIPNQGSTHPSIVLSPGRLYAGGMLAELEADTDFLQQTDWPIPPQATWNTLFPNGPAWPGIGPGIVDGAKDLFYIEVWQRHVQALNDEAARDQAFSDSGGNPDWNARPEVGDFIRERALGGPDTCTRLQTVAQVKVWDATQQNPADCPAACAALATAQPPGPPGTLGTLQVNVTPTPPVQQPCEVPLSGGYGGAENCMYRVEIHDPGPAGTATFKWSRENGAFTVRVNAQTLTPLNAATDLILRSIGNDQTTQLRQNDFVEMCGEETELGMFRNNLAQLLADPVAQPDGTWKVQLARPVVIPRAPFLRRWSADTQIIILNTPFNLDAGSGLSVSFFDATGGTQANTFFHDLDFWVWSARTLTRDIEPADISHTPQATRGIDRHRCCLALVAWTVTPNIDVGPGAVAGAINECPDLFPPLTEIPTGDGGCCFCTITVGDGQTSHGQFNDIPTAFAHIPQGGAIVCILPGNYFLRGPVAIPQDNVVVRGAGLMTRISGPNGVFTATQRNQIVITELAMESVYAPVLAFTSSQNVWILENQIAQDGPTSVAVSVQGQRIFVARNNVLGDNRGGGGIEVRGSSQLVRIRDNHIADGLLRGITLGSLQPPVVIEIARRTAVEAASTANPRAKRAKAVAAAPVAHAGEVPPPSEGPVDSVEIDGNVIENMGLDGVGVALPAPDVALADGFGSLSAITNLRIVDNTIRHCWQPPDGSAPNATVFSGIVGAISLADVEHVEIESNRIEDNGSQAPISGIFIFLGVALRIDDNRVLRNGSTREHSGTRGAIVIQLALPAADPRGQPMTDGWRAASLHNNTVEADSAHALLLTGAGAMSMRGNRFMRQRLLASDAVPGSTVSVINFGVGEDFAGFLGTANLTPVQPLSGGQSNPLLQFLELLGGETLFTENQCLLSVGEEAVLAPASVLILSLDDLNFSGNQLRCQTATGQTNQPFLIFDSFLFALSNRVENNRFTEALNGTWISCLGVGALATGIGNQATHCLLFKGTRAQAVGMNLVNPAFEAFCASLTKLIVGKSKV